MPEPTPATVHASPRKGSGLTPCCGRTPFELPRTDRISIDPFTVTCGDPGTTAPTPPDAPDQSAEATCCVCAGSPAVYRNYRDQPFCAHCANCQCGENPCVRTGVNDRAISSDARLREQVAQALYDHLTGDHRADSPWEAVKAGYLDAADAVLRVPAIRDMRERIVDYENRITWETSCGSCARVLDSSILEHERAEKAEAAVEQVRQIAEHHLHDSDDGTDPCAAAILDAIDGQPQPAEPPVHVGGRANAEHCPACRVDPPPYPWICPGNEQPPAHGQQEQP